MGNACSRHRRPPAAFCYPKFPNSGRSLGVAKPLLDYCRTDLKATASSNPRRTRYVVERRLSPTPLLLSPPPDLLSILASREASLTRSRRHFLPVRLHPPEIRLSVPSNWLVILSPPP